jgi:hypothetical protein
MEAEGAVPTGTGFTENFDRNLKVRVAALPKKTNDANRCIAREE